MFNIFEEENEQVTEQAKVRMLLKRSSTLSYKTHAVRCVFGHRWKALPLQNVPTICPLKCPNFPINNPLARFLALALTVARVPIKTHSRRRAWKWTKGIHMPDGSVWTGFYSDWNQLSKEDRQTVMETRKANKSKSSKKDNNKVNKYKDIKAKVAELKRSLAAIQSKQSGACEGCDDDDSDAPDNAGDSFGGRQKKKQKKE
ncbi:hypothetical protein MHU86_401 [Fragilaria crotonensis]|nr:hypothetical protein MHU86_401 [Fragilaria crotonensis]